MSDTEPQVVTLHPTTVALVRETVRMDGLRDFYDRAYGTVARVLQQQALAPAGPALGIYFSTPTETVDLGAGFPVVGEVVPTEGVSAVTLPGGLAVQVEHRGPYDSLPATYTRLMEWVHDGGDVMRDLMWETYVTEPSPGADPDDMVTLVTWPFAR